MVRISFPGPGRHVHNPTEAHQERRQVGPKGHKDHTLLLPLAQMRKGMARG